MRKAVYFLVIGVTFLTAGCGAILPTYKQPEEGPRSKLRVIYGGGGAKFHPGKDCQIGRTKFGLDVMGVRVPGFGAQRKLDMPLQPEGGFYDEVYVRSGEPLTARYVYRVDTGQGMSGRGIEECATGWFTFVPEQDGHYEMAFTLQRNMLGRIQGCSASLARIIESKPGEFRHEPMEMRSPAPVKCSK